MSALASLWSSRQQYVRETRVEIFGVVLPTVHDGGPARPRPPTDPEARWDELFRAAQSLDGRDWRRVAPLRFLVGDWGQYLSEAIGDGPVDGECVCDEDKVADARSREVKVRRVLSDYENWLGRRALGWGGSPTRYSGDEAVVSGLSTSSLIRPKRPHRDVAPRIGDRVVNPLPRWPTAREVAGRKQWRLR